MVFDLYRWQPDETDDSQSEYIHSLMDSDLVLHPVGMNTECYRIYEALSYGSVPIVEDVYTQGNCKEATSGPLRLLKQYKAPVIYVTNWDELDQILANERKMSLMEIVERRKMVLEWYQYFKKTMQNIFLDTIENKFTSYSNR